VDGITFCDGLLRTARKTLAPHLPFRKVLQDNKANTDCVSQLLTMDALQHSGNEDYKEVSEILQNKLYYDKETLDMALNVLKAYKQQPLRYADFNF
jgi:uncharacterized protein YwgA